MIELRRTKSRVSMSPTVWMLTLEFAKVCGWHPIGTLKPSSGTEVQGDSLGDVRHLMSWQTEYVCNDGQKVTGSDAMELATALERAAAQGNHILSDLSNGQIKPPAEIRTPAGGFRWFSTLDGKHHLHNLAGFCRDGEFQIF